MSETNQISSTNAKSVWISKVISLVDEAADWKGLDANTFAETQFRKGSLKLSWEKAKTNPSAVPFHDYIDMIHEVRRICQKGATSEKNQEALKIQQAALPLRNQGLEIFG